MSVFTERDFTLLNQGYLLKDILKDHVKNYDELYRLYTAFYKDWGDSVDNRSTFLKDINKQYEAFETYLNAFFLFAGENIRIKVFLKKSVYNTHQLPLKFGTTPEEDFREVYPDCKEELIKVLAVYFVNSQCNWAEFVEAWNNSLESTNDMMHLEFPIGNTPKSNFTLSFPKKYLIGDYDD